MLYLHGNGILRKDQAIDISTCPTEGVDLKELVKHKRIHINWRKRVYLMPLGEIVALGEITKAKLNEKASKLTQDDC